jgi:NAD(P)H-dependent flavin oxidoreductase YrpB (nitropropane dioxygenase family)
VRTTICDLLGIDLPLLAFSHCRDVVAAVTNAGGFGVLGASGYSPAALERELAWIDDHVGDRPYGLDVLVPATLVGKGEHLTGDQLSDRIPRAHRDFTRDLLDRYGVPAPEREVSGNAAKLDEGAAAALLDVAFEHPIRLIANALGVPPAFMIDRAKAAGVPVAALVGTKEHAVKQVHAGVEIIVAQGTEAGGHCGEITTIVLVPEVVRALRELPGGRDVPVLAAGGIVTGEQMAAAIALGAAGAWTGSVWLTTEEAETAPHTKSKLLAATSRDTIRSASRTGKPSRQLRSAWHEAWDGPQSPGALPMPLMIMLSSPALHRVDVAAETGNPGAQELATYFVGQGVGLLNRVRPAREVVYEMAADFAEAIERVSAVARDAR